MTFIKNMISFTAKFIRLGEILGKSQNGDEKNLKVAFVEMDPQCSEDVLAMRKLNSLWGSGRTYAEEIYDHMDDDYYRTTPKHYYALTFQRKHLDKLDPLDIVGIAEICKKSDNSIHLNYLQADPENNNSAFDRTYKKIGTSLLNCLKENFPTSDITVMLPYKEVEKFYEQNGFKDIGCGVMKYSWQA